jgi:membrane protein
MRLLGGGRLPFGQFLRRLYRVYQDDLLFDCAAQLSYYFLFSLFPFLFFLVALTAYLPIGEVLERLIPQLRALAPVQVADFVEQNVRATFSQQRPSLLVLSLLAAVFSASRGIDAIRRVLNLAYDVKESRPFWRTELIAVGITIAGAASVLSGLALLVVGGEVGSWLAERAHIEWAFVVLVQQLRWPVTGLLIALLVATAYHLLPDVEQRMRFMVPGSIAATALWLLATWAFGEYVATFNSYNVTYGSLGGMVVLLVWLYLSGFVFVLGGAINAVLEHASVNGKARGARSEREPSPPAAVRPSAAPPGAAASATVAKRSASEERANPDNV